MVPRLTGKNFNFFKFLLSLNSQRYLDTKKTTPNIAVCFESPGAMLEYWYIYIERGLLERNTARFCKERLSFESSYTEGNRSSLANNMTRIERKYCLISTSYLTGLFDIFILLHFPIETWRFVCYSRYIRNVTSQSKICKFNMFISAVCFLFLMLPHIWQNCACFGDFLPMTTLCDAYRKGFETH